ncbi:hypothetical protein BO94DRAFT_461987, partial [Aspergillus sclerotioniger CBS 115572]
ENRCIYQGQGINSYILPCDEMEQDCLNFMHTLVMKKLLGHILYAHNSRFLDLGCGTGIWIIKITEVYLNTYILEVDILVIQPDFYPQNCVFKVSFNYKHF